MTVKPKQKLCWNCEGSTTFEAQNCPYCGVYLSPLSIADSKGKDSLFAPPYRIQSAEAQQEVPVAPYVTQEEPAVATVSKEIEEEPEAVQEEQLREEPVDVVKATVMPLMLLLTGSVLFLFSVALVLFSYRGVFTLQWNSDYWFLYLACGLPMLFFGWKLLKQVPEQE